MRKLCLDKKERLQMSRERLVGTIIVTIVLLACVIMTKSLTSAPTIIIIAVAVWICVGAFFSYHTGEAVMDGWIPEIEFSRPIEASLKQFLCFVLGPFGFFIYRQAARSYY